MSKVRESMSKVGVSIRVLALVVAIGGGWVFPSLGQAEDELQKALSEAGQI
jgi:hypothetical protein